MDKVDVDKMVDLFCLGSLIRFFLGPNDRYLEIAKDLESYIKDEETRKAVVSSMMKIIRIQNTAETIYAAMKLDNIEMPQLKLCVEEVMGRK